MLLRVSLDAFESFLERSHLAAENLPDELGRYMNNIVRARSTIEQLGTMNPWQYFVTFTISPDKFDRYDFKTFYKTFSNFVAHYKRKTGVKIAYVFVPERHKDGAWHLHGLINNLPVEHLRPFTLGEKLPHYIRDKLRQGLDVYEWPAFAEKFGYTVVEPLRDPERAASYITKYIGKGFAKDYMMKNARLFMPSLGLKRAELIKKGFADLSSAKPVYDCEYATTYKFPKSEYSLDDVQSMFL